MQSFSTFLTEAVTDEDVTFVARMVPGTTMVDKVEVGAYDLVLFHSALLGQLGLPEYQLGLKRGAERFTPDQSNLEFEVPTGINYQETYRSMMAQLREWSSRYGKLVGFSHNPARTKKYAAKLRFFGFDVSESAVMNPVTRQPIDGILVFENADT